MEYEDLPKLEPITVYRAINDKELNELIKMNGGNIKEILAFEKEVNFTIYKETLWDRRWDNWPRILLKNGERKLIVQIIEKVLDCHHSEHLDADNQFLYDDNFIWLKARITGNTKAKIWMVSRDLVDEKV